MIKVTVKTYGNDSLEYKALSVPSPIVQGKFLSIPLKDGNLAIAIRDIEWYEWEDKR